MRGGCLCGAVRFVYDGPLGGDLGTVTVCFCAQCRRVQGLGCAVAPALADSFQLIEGRDTLVEYESSPGKKRAFCGACGSPIYSRHVERPRAIRLRLGALDTPPPDLKIEARIFADHAPEWTRFDAVPSFPELEPGRP